MERDLSLAPDTEMNDRAGQDRAGGGQGGGEASLPVSQGGEMKRVPRASRVGGPSLGSGDGRPPETAGIPFIPGDLK